MNRTDTRARLNSLITDREQDLRRRRRLTWGAGALVAAAAIIAVIVSSLGLGFNRDQTVEPAAGPDPAAVAHAFLDAYAAQDGQVMASWLADGADLALGVEHSTALASWMGSGGRWDGAVGFRTLNESCQPQSGIADETQVVCTYDYHALGSDRLGLGPFSGSTLAVTVKDGKITAVRQDVPFMENGFSREMWEPFAAWVRTSYPQDAALMYSDWPSQNMAAVTDRSIALWAKHTQDYVNEKR